MRLITWSLTAALLAPWCLPSGGDAASAPEAVNRFLARHDPPLVSAVALRHLEAATRGGAMSGWIDACTVLEDGTLRYWIVAEGGSGAVRKRALVAALDGEVKAHREGHASRARLDSVNYEFLPAVAGEGVLRVGLKPKRKDALLVEGTMALSPDDADLISVEGRLVKAPSLWTRQVHVVRRYARPTGVRVPVSMESSARVLVVGTSTFAMTYRYLSINGRGVESSFPGPDSRVCAVAPAEAQ